MIKGMKKHKKYFKTLVRVTVGLESLCAMNIAYFYGSP